ncbi:hypothetical protein JCM14635_03250 [Megalodesulfovibrio paquesii]
MGVLLLAACTPVQVPSLERAFSEHGSAEQLYSRGVSLYNQKDYLGAIKAWEQAFSKDPNHKKALRNLSFSYSYLNYKLQLQPEVVEYYHKGFYYCEQILKADPNNADAHMLIALFSQHLNDFSTAIAHYQQLLKITPNTNALLYKTEAQRADVYYMLGLCYGLTKDYKNARDYFVTFTKKTTRQKTLACNWDTAVAMIPRLDRYLAAVSKQADAKKSAEAVARPVPRASSPPKPPRASVIPARPNAVPPAAPENTGPQRKALETPVTQPPVAHVAVEDESAADVAALKAEIDGALNAALNLQQFENAGL